MGLVSGLDTPERMAAINSWGATPAELQPRLGTPEAFVVAVAKNEKCSGLAFCRGIFGSLDKPRSTAHKKGGKPRRFFHSTHLFPPDPRCSSPSPPPRPFLPLTPFTTFWPSSNHLIANTTAYGSTFFLAHSSTACTPFPPTFLSFRVG